MFAIQLALGAARLLLLAVAVVGIAFVSSEGGEAVGFDSRTILPLTAFLVAASARPGSRAADRMTRWILLGERKEPAKALQELAETLRSSVASNELIQGVLVSFASMIGGAQVSIWTRVGLEGFVLAYSSQPNLVGSRTSDLDRLDEHLFEIGDPDGEHDHYLSIHGRTLTPPEIELTKDVVAQLSVAINNSRLVATLETNLTELTAAEQDLKDLRRKIVEAQEAERRRLERDLHDGAQQYLIGLGLRLRIAAESGTRHPGHLRNNIQEALRINIAAIRSLESIAGDAFLTQTDLVRVIKETTEFLPIRAEFVNELLREHAAPGVNAALNCCLEALQNSVKHSQADTVRVRLWDEGGLRFSIEDDGVGFDVSKESAGFGLVSLRQRLAEAGGVLEVASAPGAGTCIEGWIPHREEGR